ncbi:MAG: hypothetical protein DMG12_09030 [Acidobacteria bacterium]|nr:MAG: hypothetical protein DMG12_09030 [Acidobacteriota bacterium]
MIIKAVENFVGMDILHANSNVVSNPAPVFPALSRNLIERIERGALWDHDGKHFQTPDGVRNNAKSILMMAQGFKGRAK